MDSSGSLSSEWLTLLTVALLVMSLAVCANRSVLTLSSTCASD